MFNLVLLKKYEGKLMPSGNPIIYEAVVTPGYFFNFNDLYVQATIKVQKYKASAVYDLIKTEKIAIGEGGIFSFDISSLCEPYLQFFIPKWNLDNTVECVKQVLNFSVTFDLYWEANNNNKEATVTDTVRVIKAGASYEYFMPVLGELLYGDEERFLFASQLDEDNAYNKETVFADDYFWLSLLIPGNNFTQYFFDYVIQYLDINGNEQTLTGQLHPVIASEAESKVICYPAGFKQNRLDALLPAGSIPIYYYIDIYYKVAGVKTYRNLYPYPRFYIEQRNFPGHRKLVYRNSLGSLMPLSLKGEIEQEATYESTISNVRPLKWLKDKNVVPQIKQHRATEDNKFKGETGFITAFEMQRLRDFFLSDERYENIDGRLVPIVLTGKTAKLPATTDTLYSMPVEWQHAWRNNYFTAFDVGGKSCPAMLLFSWEISFNDSINVFYALPAGYDYFRVTVEFPDEPPQYFYVEGNSGVSNVKFNRPASAPGAVEITVRGNVMCERYNKVPTYGPTNTPPAQVIPGALPLFAGADTFNILPGITTPTVLGNVLTNDYDPAGGEIEAVVVNNVATNAGGTISIAADGTVTYTPPDAAFTGVDGFEYDIQNVGDSNTVSGIITIRVEENSTNAIWASDSHEELTPSGFNWFYNKHYIALWNGPASIVPVNGDNLLVNYRKRVEVSNSTNNFADPAVTEVDLNVLINGTNKVLVHTGNPETLEIFWDLGYTQKTVISWQVLPGDGYNVI